MSSAHNSNSAVIWLTGLSGAGKTTIAKILLQKLTTAGLQTELLDGDDVRKKFPGLGFSKAERLLQAERVVGLARQIENQNKIALVALITPYSESRQHARIKCKNYFEIYLSTSLNVCIQRDPKGLYKKTLSGELQNFTGISDPYEVPESPDLMIDTESVSAAEAAENIYQLLQRRNKNLCST